MNPQANKQSKQVFVLDTSALLAGFDPFAISEAQATVPQVEQEIRKNSMIYVRFRTAVENEKVRIKAPSEESLNKIRLGASNLGDSYLLSNTDVQILALALEMKDAGENPQIVTDDYSIQNVATQMGIEFLALATFGIKRLLEWVRYCPACHREYSANCKPKECIVCGTMLKRKPLKTVKSLKSKNAY